MVIFVSAIGNTGVFSMRYQLPLCCLVCQSIHRQELLGIQQNYFWGSSLEEGFGNTVLETHAATPFFPPSSQVVLALNPPGSIVSQ